MVLEVIDYLSEEFPFLMDLKVVVSVQKLPADYLKATRPPLHSSPLSLPLFSSSCCLFELALPALCLLRPVVVKISFFLLNTVLF